MKRLEISSTLFRFAVVTLLVVFTGAAQAQDDDSSDYSGADNEIKKPQKGDRRGEKWERRENEKRRNKDDRFSPDNKWPGRGGRGDQDGRVQRGRDNQENHNWKQNPGMNFLKNLSEEEKEKLKKLRKEDPKAFREEIKKKIQEMHGKRQKDKQKINELISKYRKASSPEEKQKYLNEIKQETKKEFERKMKENDRHLEEAQKRLEEFRKKIETRRKKADEIIDRRMKELTTDPDLRW